MAVLVEGISVIVRRDAIDRCFENGWREFVTGVPNATLCTDGQLARVGFMDATSVESFIDNLRSHGLVFVSEGRCVHIAVIDQLRGPTMPCDWIEFARLPMEDGHIGACWLSEGPRIAAGLHLPGQRLELATPAGWTYQGSLSHRFTFMPSQNDPGLRH